MKSKYLMITLCVTSLAGGLKEQVQQSVNFSEHANHETECNPVSETSLPLGV
ncbi:hypothetical protein [Pseudomonas arcuscaelestis]|uniref:hypothetical protein n=1 Tax=Pseudomonas arcuscaelestis TaxID=2710591 RepID=UPI00193CD2B4|nr:hypothetical protein [Pseudomonas arcuscaelestis]MBM3112069.1 hypothetical protein [Pseudomonas arcuscaelestis]